MRRIDALRPLSIDHHHGLVLAHKAKSAANGDHNDDELQAVWSALETHARDTLATHFDVEETCLTAALNALNDAHITSLLQRMRDEHAVLRTLLSPTAARTPHHLKQVGELLARHIRFEERELFDIAQNRLDPTALAIIADACKKP